MKLKSFCSKYIKFTSSLFIAILAPKPREWDTTDNEGSQSAGQAQQETPPDINSRREILQSSDQNRSHISSSYTNEIASSIFF